MFGSGIFTLGARLFLPPGDFEVLFAVLAEVKNHQIICLQLLANVINCSQAVRKAKWKCVRFEKFSVGLVSSIVIDERQKTDVKTLSRKGKRVKSPACGYSGSEKTLGH